jgi:hypothetical protein
MTTPTAILRARRAAACDWYEVKEWQKCLDGHSAARDAIDPDATPMSMGNRPSKHRNGTSQT